MSREDQADGVEFRTGVGPYRVSGNRSRAPLLSSVIARTQLAILVVSDLRSVVPVLGRYLPAGVGAFFFFAAARRSAFFRRTIRFLTLSLP